MVFEKYRDRVPSDELLGVVAGLDEESSVETSVNDVRDVLVVELEESFGA